RSHPRPSVRARGPSGSCPRTDWRRGPSPLLLVYPSARRTRKLRRQIAPVMKIFVGTSGFSYAPWRGSFYPEKLPAAKMLGYYAERLEAVEINNTFYRMPSADALAKWAAETPPSFRFALKSPRR